jgi:hypothetical protein
MEPTSRRCWYCQPDRTFVTSLDDLRQTTIDSGPARCST